MSLCSITASTRSRRNWQMNCLRHVCVTAKSSLQRTQRNSPYFCVQIQDKDSGSSSIQAAFVGKSAILYHDWIKVGNVYNIAGGFLRRANKHCRCVEILLDTQAKITLVKEAQFVTRPPRIVSTTLKHSQRLRMQRRAANQCGDDGEESLLTLSSTCSTLDPSKRTNGANAVCEQQQRTTTSNTESPRSHSLHCCKRHPTRLRSKRLAAAKFVAQRERQMAMTKQTGEKTPLSMLHNTKYQATPFAPTSLLLLHGRGRFVGQKMRMNDRQANDQQVGGGNKHLLLGGIATRGYKTRVMEPPPLPKIPSKSDQFTPMAPSALPCKGLTRQYAANGDSNMPQSCAQF